MGKKNRRRVINYINKNKIKGKPKDPLPCAKALIITFNSINVDLVILLNKCLAGKYVKKM